MNSEIAKAISLPIRIALLIVIGVLCYFFVPPAVWTWIKEQAGWALSKVPSGK